MVDDDSALADDNAFIDAVALMRKYRLDQGAESELRRFRARRAAFNRRTRRNWGDAFDACTRVATYAAQFGNDLAPELHAHLESEKPHLVNVMARLHASACLVAFEILALLQAGLANAALARWRTLHEIAVTALFIQERGEDAALRYWMHGAVERKRLANEQRRAGLEPLEPQVLEEIDHDRDAAIARWGTSFDGTYGWAADLLGTKNPTFRAIEEAVDVLPRDSRWAYKWASVLVHPQVWGITIGLGLNTDVDNPTAGQSVIGLDLPANGTIVSLLQCTAALWWMDEGVEWMIRMAVLTQLVEEARVAIGAAARNSEA